MIIGYSIEPFGQRQIRSDADQSELGAPGSGMTRGSRHPETTPSQLLRRGDYAIMFTVFDN